MRGFKQAFVPESWRYQRATDWDGFFGACVVYDPPELELASFAKYSGTNPEGSNHPETSRSEGSESPRMVAPPIRWLPTSSEVSERMGDFYDALIEELGRRYVEPTGKSTSEAINEILRDTGLQEKHLAEQRWDRRPYVALDGLPQDEEIVNALRMFRATRERNRGGKPPRDRLLAIKCAALYYNHNANDPEDKRRRRWTYERLTEEIVKRASGQSSKNKKRVGEEYVKLGQELRRKRKKQRYINSPPVLGVFLPLTPPVMVVFDERLDAYIRGC
jgi:hypothetical protein